MPRKTSKKYAISRIQMGFKPYDTDQSLIDNLTKNEFKNNQADCIRTLVREALTRRRLVQEGKDATMSIVKASQAEVVEKKLNPIKNQLDELTNEIKKLTEAQNSLTKGVTNSNQQLIANINSVNEKLSLIDTNNLEGKTLTKINEQLIKLTATLQPISANNTAALKNIIAIRSLFYVFLLGYQSGSIEEANKLTREQWVYFVRDVQKKINNLSVEEFNNLDAIEQHRFIEDLARQLFEQIRIVSREEIKSLKNQ